MSWIAWISASVQSCRMGAGGAEGVRKTTESLMRFFESEGAGKIKPGYSNGTPARRIPSTNRSLPTDGR